MNCFEVQNRKTPEELSQWVKSVDNAFDMELRSLAERITAHRDLHFLGLTGPTCSGKTTAANKLTACMEGEGRRLQVISIDDFYHDKEHLARLSNQKGTQSLDYDSEETIDVDLFERCISSLRKRQPTRLPHFNFRSGLREEGILVDPRPDDVFLFEGIQILYPLVDGILSGEGYRSIYICPASAIIAGGETFFPNEIRFLRRLVRDYRHRGASPEFTMLLWNSVRENEERSIFPYAHRCSETVNSTMEYEIGMLKPFLLEMFEKNPVSGEFKETVENIRRRLANVQVVPADFITKNSLYKEFI